MQTGAITYAEGPKAASVLKTGQKNVTTAGTAVAMPTLNGIRQVLIQAKRTNSGIVYVGPSTVLNDDTNGIYLNKGDIAKFDCTSLQEIYVNSTVNGEGVTYLCW